MSSRNAFNEGVLQNRGDGLAVPYLHIKNLFKGVGKRNTAHVEELPFVEVRLRGFQAVGEIHVDMFVAVSHKSEGKRY